MKNPHSAKYDTNSTAPDYRGVAAKEARVEIRGSIIHLFDCSSGAAMPLILALLAILSAHAPTPSNPQVDSAAIEVLRSVRSLRCEFPNGQVTKFEGEMPVLAQKSPGEPAEFDAIDRAAHHARLIGKQGAGDISVLAGRYTLTLTEVTPLGVPHITVVFAAFRPGTQDLLAMDSEFVLGPIIKTPYTGQYFGSCHRLQ